MCKKQMSREKIFWTWNSSFYTQHTKLIFCSKLECEHKMYTMHIQKKFRIFHFEILLNAFSILFLALPWVKTSCPNPLWIAELDAPIMEKHIFKCQKIFLKTAVLKKSIFLTFKMLLKYILAHGSIFGSRSMFNI